MLTYIEGNIIDFIHSGNYDIAAHGCNCFHIMGAGVAGQFSRIFPGVYAADLKTIYGDRSKLGTYSSYKHNDVTILNLYTQYNPGKDVSYDAIRSCFININNDFTKKPIIIPKIGAGIAGGNWKVISDIIDEVSINNDITVVEYFK